MLLRARCYSFPRCFEVVIHIFQFPLPDVSFDEMLLFLRFIYSTVTDDLNDWMVRFVNSKDKMNRFLDENGGGGSDVDAGRTVWMCYSENNNGEISYERYRRRHRGK